MDLCAVFVDAGYLYAASEITCLGVTKPSRKNLQLDVRGVVFLLRKRAANGSGQRHLRTYWYDGAAGGVPTRDHQRIDLIDDVKVRLGRMNARGQQKGVDALIYRDLMTLARERAITHAYLFTGDGDLVEGVRVAQDLGVHVTLMYIQGSDRGNNVSPELLREVDRRIELSNTDLAPFVAPAAPAAPLGADSSVLSESEPRPEAPGNVHAQITDQELVGEIARKYAQEWMGRATDADVHSLTAGHPQIPQQLDAELLRRAEMTAGPLGGRQSLRHSLRSAFWNELLDHKPSQANGQGQEPPPG